MYSHDCKPHSYIQYIEYTHTHMIYTKKCSYTHVHRVLRELLHWESITHSAAYFWGSKDHTPLCACVLGHVLKMYQLTNTSVWYIRKTNADLHSPKEHFRHLHQKYPKRHKPDRIGFTFFSLTFAIRWNIRCLPEMKQQVTKTDILPLLNSIMWICMARVRFNEKPTFLIFLKWICE